MALSSRYLNDGERVVVSTRTHVKALLVPVVVLMVVLVVAGVLSALVGGAWAGVPQIVIWVVVVALLVGGAVRPFVRWLTTTYTFTDRRLITRSGLLAKEGRTIPLNRISGVDFEMGVVDRLLGCGTLVVSDASTDGRVGLPDIPRVEQVQLQIAAELDRLGRHEHPHHHDDGS